MLEEQGAACKICKSKFGVRSDIAIDHDHATGRVRGLLCKSCNTAIGFLKEDPIVARAALRYVEEADKINFVDIRTENEKHYNVFKYLDIDSSHLLRGPEEKRFREKLRKKFNAKDCVTCGNATDAISAVVENAYCPGTPVVLPNFTAYPTAVALRHVRREDLYYVDVDDSMCIDVRKLPDVNGGIVIYVSLFGNNLGDVELGILGKYCRENKMTLVEDAAQSFGSRGISGVDYKIFSFYPTKILNTIGDGGAILSADANLEKLRKKMFYGIDENRNYVEVDGGINSRLSEICANVLNTKLEAEADERKLTWLINTRRNIAHRYLKQIRGIKWDRHAVFHQFVVLFENRDRVIIPALRTENIPFSIHYPYHITDMAPLKSGNNSNTVGYRVNKEIISLPVHPFMKENQIQRVEEFLWRYRNYEII